MMMAEDGGDVDIFVYMGGDQVVPDDVVRVRIDKSVKIIPQRAFYNRRRLIDVEFHDGIEEIGNYAFYSCILMRGVKLLGVKVIKMRAFQSCFSLTEVEFGAKLETIGSHAFYNCTTLRSVTSPSVKKIGTCAFKSCQQLIYLDLPEGLETIQESAFHRCLSLRRIAMPLKSGMVGRDAYYVFQECPRLATVDLVGGIHNTVASLHLESWRNEMKDKINRINQVLPGIIFEGKTPEIRAWVRSVNRRLNHYKNKHRSLLKEATTLLELALWKAKIEEKEEDSLGDVITKKAKINIQSKRSERRIISGANVVIKNVLPFLELE